APLRELFERPIAATDGSPRPPKGELRRVALPAPGADRAGRTEALRDAARRQRLELVHQRRPQSRLVERPAAHTRAGKRLGLRSRGRVVAAPALARVGRVEIPVAADPRDPAAVLARLQGEAADHPLASFIVAVDEIDRHPAPCLDRLPGGGELGRGGIAEGALPEAEVADRD